MDGMDGSSKDSGAFAAGPPPVGGLGNYKGVMLCNRPEENSRGGRGGDAGAAPFKSTISATANEQVGLAPCRRTEHCQEVKTRGPSAALRRHCRWIKELQVQVKDDQKRAIDDEQVVADRKEKMQVVFKTQRDAIRQLKAEKGYDIEHHELEAILKPPSKNVSGTPAVQKPAWAMTAQENEDFNEDEASDLIRFAEEVDFDKYITDLEFRGCLRVVKDRAHKLKKEQDLFKDEILRQFNSQNEAEDGDEFDCGEDLGADGASVFGGSSASRRVRDQPGATGYQQQRRPDWDGSTVCDDDVGGGDGRSVRAAADEALSQLGSIHSRSSVQRMIEKTRAERPPS